MLIIKNIVWKECTQDAEKIFNAGVLDLYTIRDKKVISFISNLKALQDVIKNGLSIYIYIGEIPKEAIAKKGRLIHQVTFSSELYTSTSKAKKAICDRYNLDYDSFLPEKKVIDPESGSIITHYPFNQKIITRVLN